MNFMRWKAFGLRKSIVCGVLALVGTSLLNQAHAQGSKSYFVPYSTVGGGIGTSSYYGDLAPYRRPVASTFKMIRWNISGEYTRHFTPNFAARASLTWARTAGDDFTMNKGDKGYTNQFIRNLHFRNDVKELAVVGIWQFRPDNRGSDGKPQFTPYVFAGVGVFAHNPKARLPYDVANEQQGDWIELKQLATEGQGLPGQAKPYSLVQMSIPVGFGLKYKINRKFDVAAELGFRFTTTDHLDDVSLLRNDPNVLAQATNPETLQMAVRVQEGIPARVGGVDRMDILRQKLSLPDGTDPIQYLSANSPQLLQTRGTNPDRNDAYMLGTIKVIYTLGSPVKCPPLKY